MIKIDHTYHGVELARSLPNEAREWLIEKLGLPNGDIWYTRNNIIYFSKEKDHLMFLLKWG
jgi:hypothetical protein